MYKRFHHVSDISNKYRKSTPANSNLIFVAVVICLVSLFFSFYSFNSIKEMNDLEFVRNNKQCIQWLEGVNEKRTDIIYNDLIEEYGDIENVKIVVEKGDHLETLFKLRDYAELLLGLHLFIVVIDIIVDIITYTVRKRFSMIFSDIATSLIVCVLLLLTKINIGINTTLWLIVFVLITIIAIFAAINADKAEKEMISKLSEVYLYCTEKCINGIAFRNESKSTYHFEVNYIDIKRVFTSELSYKEGSYNNFHIITANASYSLGLDDNEEACNYIKKAIEEAKSSLGTQ